MPRLSLLLAGALIWVLALTPPLAAVSEALWDDFQDGTTQGWISGAPNPIPPIQIASGGPAGPGDGFLRIEAMGSLGPGSRLVAFNTSQWAGDYLAADIRAISADVKNFSSEPLELRLAFENLVDGGAFASSVGIPLLPGSDWQTVRFPVGPDQLTSVGFADYATTMSGVSRLRIVHNLEPSIVGLILVGSLGVDNVRTVPEPHTGALAVIALFLAARRCRARRIQSAA